LVDVTSLDAATYLDFSNDGQLKVYGIESLRVADGSIMPRVTTGNTMATCIIIGERAAEALRSDHRLETSSVSRSARA
jgi:choline dehydrogenase